MNLLREREKHPKAKVFDTNELFISEWALIGVENKLPVLSTFGDGCGSTVKVSKLSMQEIVKSKFTLVVRLHKYLDALL